MATKKATVKKSTTKKTTNKVVATTVSHSSGSRGKKQYFPSNIANILLAEIIGTFILTMVALTVLPILGELVVGVAFMVIILAVGLVSGAHVNPAVTFAMWTMRKINWATGLAYWAAQFIGSAVAVAVLYVVSNGAFSVLVTGQSFMNFSWSLFAVELVGAAVFLFGLTAVLSRKDLSTGSRAFGIGMSLTIGLIVAGSLLGQVHSAAEASYSEAQQKASQEGSEEQTKLAHERYVGGATLNPALAFAVSEKTDAQVFGQNSTSSDTTKPTSRFTLDTVLGTLIGAAVGANLYLLLGYKARD